MDDLEVAVKAFEEIERTYLPKEVPKALLSAAPTRIIDKYISPLDDTRTKLRLRQNGSQYELTKKINTDPHDLSVQDEYTIPLTIHEFNLLCKLEGREVTKDRYKATAENTTLEVDVFRGQLEGLILIEVEFASKSERNAFTPPAYFGQDVTQEAFVAGAYLAGKTYEDILPMIQKICKN